MVLWRKSSRSNSSANCVEVACSGRRVLARDSKNPAPELAFPAEAWRRFLDKQE
ncbi:hypothetical protein GCM10022243_12070 [Saccharothrix violaceirubra]|uniref:DUF397 domain-containing protein n=1 Tax=Saccharothrix violaceirubra TaxID=413306 RepID=A0A7W7T8U4_9PSEU|nr:DUF397 domain-containing protein [Saccharothrix violaceirubra]MBB4968706.1 hypothetical protein [Saccharothrix violaceirubra]